MPSRMLAILLLAAVTLAVGVCPCGRALILDRLTRAALPVANTSFMAVGGHCPACHVGDQSTTGSGHDAPDARRCAATVSGDLPAAATHAPVLYATPAVFQPVPLIDHLPQASAGHDDESRRSGLPPPPTLLSLSCCLTT